jgi:MFS family permease
MNAQINLRYVVFLAMTAALGGLLFGFDIAIITGAGPFLIHHFHLSDLSLGWAFSSLLFGCILGSAFAGRRLADLYGRRTSLFGFRFFLRLLQPRPDSHLPFRPLSLHDFSVAWRWGSHLLSSRCTSARYLRPLFVAEWERSTSYPS